MNEAEAIALLKEARPIFKLAVKFGASKVDENLQYGQAGQIGNIQKVWLSGRSGTEIEALCREAGYDPLQIKQVSLYLWFTMTFEKRDKVESTDYKIYFVFAMLTVLGAGIIAVFLNLIAPTSTSPTRHNSGIDFYLLVGLVVCSPIAGLGLVIRWLVKKYLVSRSEIQINRSWPEGLYPDNEATQEYSGQ